MIEAKALIRRKDGKLEEFPVVDPTKLDEFVSNAGEYHAIKINLVVRKNVKTN